MLWRAKLPFRWRVSYGCLVPAESNFNIRFRRTSRSIPASERPKLVADVLELTDLSGKTKAPVDGLSRGMKQRLGIARLLLHDPEFLLLDEPANGLDPRARIEMRELLKELQAMGKTILISSHILHELAQFCTHIGIVDAGQVMACGPLQEIYRQLQMDRAIHVQISNFTPELLASFKAIEGVSAVEELTDRLAIRIRESELSPKDLLERLLKTGARIRMFQPDAADMETAFMCLTEGKTA